MGGEAIYEEQIEKAGTHLDELLNLERQVWLFGAGISKESGIPLMYPLTARVESLLTGGGSELGVDTTRSALIYEKVHSQLHDEAHVEHLLSQLGDLVTLAERKKEKAVVIDSETISSAELRLAHRHVQLAIRYTVENGYTPASGSGEAKVHEAVGSPANVIVNRGHHDQFVRNLFFRRRAGKEQNPSVRFVTTNYDTLLEDALAHAHIGYVDGFAGGATGFWDPRNSDQRLQDIRKVNRHTASVCKLHGSIDWIADEKDVVMRVRSSVIRAGSRSQQLLIYPQATKYQVTQRDPFATLFADFRASLAQGGPSVLVVCGYSFGDDHVNEEIERALRTGPSGLTVVALCFQATDKNGELTESQGIPSAVAAWLRHPEYGSRVVVAGSHGYYRNGLQSSVQVPAKTTLPWCSFTGITDFLDRGMEALA